MGDIVSEAALPTLHSAFLPFVLNQDLRTAQHECLLAICERDCDHIWVKQGMGSKSSCVHGGLATLLVVAGLW